MANRWTSPVFYASQTSVVPIRLHTRRIGESNAWLAMWDRTQSLESSARDSRRLSRLSYHKYVKPLNYFPYKSGSEKYFEKLHALRCPSSELFKKQKAKSPESRFRRKKEGRFGADADPVEDNLIKAAPRNRDEKRQIIGADDFLAALQPSLSAANERLNVQRSHPPLAL